MIATTEIGIEPSRQNLREHPRDGAAAMHPAHERRVAVTDRERKDQLHELPVDFSDVRRVGRQPIAEPRSDVSRYWLPGRALANMLDIIEHIVEHMMT